jgi:hypothetical protein
MAGTSIYRKIFQKMEKWGWDIKKRPGIPGRLEIV